MKATTGRTVTAAQRKADKERLKTPEGQAAIDALRAKLRADLIARTTPVPAQPKKPEWSVYMTSTNSGPVSFKPVKIAGKSWWVPKVHSAELAVPLENPVLYRQAIRAKMVELIRKEGLAEARARVADILAGDHINLDDPLEDSPEQLVREILEKSPATSMKVWEGDPAASEPASLADATQAVADQADLDLVDLLG